MQIDRDTINCDDQKTSLSTFCHGYLSDPLQESTASLISFSVCLEQVKYKSDSTKFFLVRVNRLAFGG